MWQYLASRFESAFPDVDLRITMCHDCHDDLEVLDVQEGGVDLRDGPDNDWKAMQNVVDKIPPESLYVNINHQH